MSAANRTPKMSVRALIMDLIGNSFFIALNASFLVLYPITTMAPDGTDTARVCEKNVQTYLLGQLALYCLYSFPQRPLQYYIENYNPELRRNSTIRIIWGFWSFCTLFDIVWFFLGQYWVFTSTLCKTGDPQLYWLAMAQIIFFYVTTILPILIYIGLICLYSRRYLRQQDGVTGPAAHLRGGLSKAELATLRTFVFKTSMAAVSPEEDEEKGVSSTENNAVTGLAVLDSMQMHEIVGSKENDSPAVINIAASDSDQGKLSPYVTAISQSSAPTSGSAREESKSLPQKDATPVEADLPSGAVTNCAICFCDFEAGDVIRELACAHLFHVDCIDPWLIVPDADASKPASQASSSAPTKAHRTCPLCVREAILPEFRDKDVELAMELQKKEEAEMAKLLERLKKEAEEEQQLIERRKKRDEERRQRRATGNTGLGSLLGVAVRGRSRTVDPAANKALQDTGKRSASVAQPSKVDTSTADAPPSGASASANFADEVSSDSSMAAKTPKERVSTMKLKLQSIQSRLMDNEAMGGSFAESLASAKAIEAIIDDVHKELQEEENGILNAALHDHAENIVPYEGGDTTTDEKTNDEKTDDSNIN